MGYSSDVEHVYAVEYISARCSVVAMFAFHKVCSSSSSRFTKRGTYILMSYQQ